MWAKISKNIVKVSSKVTCFLFLFLFLFFVLLSCWELFVLTILFSINLPSCFTDKFRKITKEKKNHVITKLKNKDLKTIYMYIYFFRQKKKKI